MTTGSDIQDPGTYPPLEGTRTMDTDVAVDNRQNREGSDTSEVVSSQAGAPIDLDSLFGPNRLSTSTSPGGINLSDASSPATGSNMTFAQSASPKTEPDQYRLSFSPVIRPDLVPTSDPDIESSPLAASDGTMPKITIQSTNCGLDDSQIGSSSPAQESYEPRYSPPNMSAVSSTLASPVTPCFSRPRHPHSVSPGDDSSSSTPREDETEVTPPAGLGVAGGISYADPADKDGDDAGGYDDEKGRVTYDEIPLEEWDVNDSDIYLEKRENVLSVRASMARQAARESSEQDNFEDVMNPKTGGVRGYIIPKVDRITSVDKEDLDEILNSLSGDIDEHSQGRKSASSPTPNHPRIRRASSPTGQSLTSIPGPGPAPTPKGAHIKFATNDSPQETPFARTMKYFKQFKDKENTPSKSRRNASLAEDISELAKDAQQEGIDDDKAMWDKYREIDFAPEDPVMEDELAGDLIISGTPMKQDILTLPPTYQASGEPTNNKKQAATPKDKEKGTVYEVSIPGHYGDAFSLRFRSTSDSFERIASFIRRRGEDLEAKQKDLDLVVKQFLSEPWSYIVADEDVRPGPLEEGNQDGNCGPDPLMPASVEAAERTTTQSTASEHTDNDGHNKQLILYREDPVFIKVIGMLPEAMFWVVAKPVAHYTNKAFDNVFQKLKGLTLGKSCASE